MAERLAASRFAARAGAGYAPGHGDSAGLGVRGLAYLIDSIVLFVFATMFSSIAGLILFFRSEDGQQNASDAAIWTFVIMLMLTVPAWLLVNLVLGSRTGQTVGQFVTGLYAVREDGGRIGAPRLLVYWLALHPLLFHPFVGGFWLLFAYVVLVLATNDVLFIAACAMALLCLVAPIAGLLFALGDPQHRAIHDRLAGAKVVRIE
jgi:uncharacterized RDD family membrane protein YckC